MTERRQEGVNRVRFSDGNGGTTDVYTMTANRIKVWVSLLVSVGALLTMVFAATRFGVGIEIHKVVDEEVLPPDGVIYKQIEKTSTEVVEEIQGVIQDDLDVLDKNITEEHDRVIRIEERQIAIQRKMEQDKEDILRAIRAQGGSG